MKNELELFNQILLDNKDITASRMSIINGKRDFTQLGETIIMQSKEFLAQYEDMVHGAGLESCDCIAKVILSEIYYQKDDCYKALVMVNSALAFLEKDGHEEIWAVARYIQMCIMIVTGQLKAIYPMVDGMRERIYASKNKRLIANYDALCAWCALYDDDWKSIDSWMKDKAPNEYGSLNHEKTFELFTKARIYYTQGQHLAAVTLLQNMDVLLEREGRVMEQCEAYMLIAMSLYEEGHKEEAYEYIDKCLDIACDRGFVRLLADEGESMYILFKDYIKGREFDEMRQSFIKEVIKKSRDMALMYPRYLKNHKQDFPKLTGREVEILRLIVDGRNNSQIADFFDSSPNTIKFHIKNIYRKLGVNSREDAIKAAIEERLIN